MSDTEEVLREELDVIEDCEWCQRYEAVGLFNLDEVETGLCAGCAEDNEAENCE
ncbi:hypothetical protein OHB13_11700 [Streptomyces sp. NBC_00440]|uniref:hypothetical protein n=1 Tax=Streptomyces sp. NBC_00440 TaxID=2975741 RepID=UPI002E2171E4